MNPLFFQEIGLEVVFPDGSVSFAAAVEILFFLRCNRFRRKFQIFMLPLPCRIDADGAGTVFSVPAERYRVTNLYFSWAESCKNVSFSPPAAEKRELA